MNKYATFHDEMELLKEPTPSVSNRDQLDLYEFASRNHWKNGFAYNLESSQIFLIAFGKLLDGV